MTKTNDEYQAPLQSIWTTEHAAGVIGISQAGIDVHADSLNATNSYSKIAAQPTYKFDQAAQVSNDDDLRKHTVTIGKTADAHKSLAQAYQQMSLTDAELTDLQVKP